MKKQMVKRLLSAALVSAMVISSVNVADTAIAAKAANLSFEKLDSPVINYDDLETNTAEEEEDAYQSDETVRVFIEMAEESVVDAGFSTADLAENDEAIAYSEKLEEAQEEVVEKIEEEVLDGEELDQRYNFTLLTNAVSADVTYGDIEDILAVDGVENVYIVPQYEPQAKEEADDTLTMTSGEMVGSYNTWANGYTGAGMRVAIIDTGLDSDHPSFDSDAYMVALEEQAAKAGKTVTDYDLLDEEEIASVVDLLNANKMYKGLTAEKLNLNDKVAYAFNYVDQDLDITHDNDSQGEHGTHVAGISTANRYVPQEDGSYAAQENGVVGVAPEAQLLVMKVFGKGGGAYPDDYMAAIEDAIILGADAVNLSLGSSSAGESSAAEAYINSIMDKLLTTDTVVSISAGNAGYWSENSYYGANLTSDVDVDTVGSPGSYTNAFTVASAVNSGYTGYSALFNDTTSAFYDDGSSASNRPFSSLDTKGDGTEYEYVLLTGKGEAADFENVDVKGKIVLVSRGAISFYVKHDNAEAAGAIGVLVYNNTTGTIGMNLTGSSATIPCASITLAEAEAIKEGASYDETTGAYYGKTVVYSKASTKRDVEDGYSMSDFSSWGVPGTLELKPEITAPGGNIYSTVDNGGYANMSGTSMAAPSVTGISALVIQYIEENDLATKTGLTERALAQSLLMSTSTPLTEKSGIEYSPRKQGSGLANANLATTSPAYILMDQDTNKDGKVKAELGDDPERTGSYSFGFDVKNLTDSSVYYSVDSSVLTESVADEYFIANSSYKLNPEVSITADAEHTVYAFDANQDGSVDEKDAATLLNYANGGKSDFIEAHMDQFDLNNTGVVDTNDVWKILNAYRNQSSDDFDLFAKEIRVDDSTKINVSIALSEEDKAYIEENFENGIYVEGFVYLNGDVNLSVPFLAFYGNWTDSSMFEPYDALEAANGGNTLPTYSEKESTNYILYKFANSSRAQVYTSNLYAKDDEYIADRNAISSTSGDVLTGFTYSLIRNAADVKLTISNAKTGAVYYSVDKGSAYGEYYSSSSGSWNNTSSTATINWNLTDAKGKALKNNTKLNVSVTALPAYYNDETKTPGQGATLTVPFTIDNEAPRAIYDAASETEMNITVQDNRYVAAVYLYKADKKTLISSTAVNQTKAGKSVSLTMEYPHELFYLTVIDYAGNATSYRVNNSDEEDTIYPTELSLSADDMKMVVGSNKVLYASLAPVTLVDEAKTLTWESSDEDVATVSETGVVTAKGVGTATITATCDSECEDGSYLTASCNVTVFTVESQLNCVLYDESAKVYFSEFNTGKLPEYNKISGAQSNYYWSATTVADKIIASVESDSQSESDYYMIDPETFESTYLYTSYWNTDMAYGLVSGQVTFGTYGNYVIVNDLAGEMKAYNVAKYLAGETVVGIAYAGYGKHKTYGYYDDFILMDNTGTLVEFAYFPGLGFMAGQIGSTGITSNGLICYQSLYYDFEEDLLFYANYDNGEEVTLYGIDINTLDSFALGKFPEKVWPVGGLYKDSDFYTADEDESEAAFTKLAGKNSEVNFVGKTLETETAQKVEPIKNVVRNNR